MALHRGVAHERSASLHAGLFEHTPTVSIRMPNGALTSLAGNVDPHHRVAVADLILVQSVSGQQ